MSRQIPWETSPAEPNEQLPLDDTPEFAGPCCAAVSPSGWFGCTLPDRHDGHHRASGIDRRVFAEWTGGASC